MTRQVRGRVVFAVAIALGTLCAVSEFVELGWWSNIRGIGAGPYQHFVDLYGGELRVGRRSTAGFFSRYIPPAGFMSEPVTPVKWDNRNWVPWLRSANMTDWLSVPLWPIVACLAAGAMYLVLSSRHHAGHCSACGYNLHGLAPGRCPECGRLPASCASSTSQPG